MGRAVLLGKLDELSEYDVRHPLTRTGTNLLGLVKHLTLSEPRHFGAIFDRPCPEPIPSFDDPGFENRDDLWVTEPESRADIIDGYNRACQHADATIDASRSRRHPPRAARRLSGQTPTPSSEHDNVDWATHRARIEQAAQATQPNPCAFCHVMDAGVGGS